MRRPLIWSIIQEEPYIALYGACVPTHRFVNSNILGLIVDSPSLLPPIRFTFIYEKQVILVSGLEAGRLHVIFISSTPRLYSIY